VANNQLIDRPKVGFRTTIKNELNYQIDLN